MIYYKNGFTDEEVSTDAFAPHIRYGAGFFETLLYSGGEVRHMDRHLGRLHSSCGEFGYAQYTFDYSGVVDRLIAENGLSEKTARVNICHLIESYSEYSVMVSAVEYTPPAAEAVLELCVYPHVHDSYLSRHKSMSYMHFYLAKRYASDKGCYDALLTDQAGNVCETSTSALLMKKDGFWIVPETENRLMSISLELFCEENEHKTAKISVEQLKNYEIYCLNSLFGMRKVVMR